MTAPRPRVAVVGSGIAGLGAAWHLVGHADVTLFEAGSRLGGHANTVDLTLDGVTHGVDTGFLVFNERTYPQLIALFDQLGVATVPSDMSFSVQVPGGLEWAGANLNTVFAQRRNLVSPRFWQMLADIVRFNREATRLALSGQEAELAQPVGEFLAAQGLGKAFRDDYLLPMVACIWSCPTAQMLEFPVATLIRFCHNHGLIQVNNRPRWFTVAGGSRQYVRRMQPLLGEVRLNTPVLAVRRLPPGSGAAGVWVDSHRGSERFDEVVLACHSDQSLALLADASPDERRVLGAIRYHHNEAVLHTDSRLLPQQRRAWSAWNYERSPTEGVGDAAPGHVCLHYLINQLQPLPWQQPVIVSLNPLRQPDPAQVHARIDYAHPVFDAAAIAAQRQLPALQGQGHVWFCGAWTRYGFHEDGLMSGHAVAQSLRAQWAQAPQPWLASA